MVEYMSREDYCEETCGIENREGYKTCYNCGMLNVPTADVQPVKRGWWIPQGDDMWLCSNCKENKIFSMHESDRTEKQRYCCKCGARNVTYRADKASTVLVRLAMTFEKTQPKYITLENKGRCICSDTDSLRLHSDDLPDILRRTKMILMINDRFYNEQEIRQLIQSQAEQITKLKKMLLQALADFETMSNDADSIHECAHVASAGSCTGCPLDNGSDCKWIYEPEALELIGEVQNDIK